MHARFAGKRNFTVASVLWLVAACSTGGALSAGWVTMDDPPTPSPTEQKSAQKDNPAAATTQSTGLQVGDKAPAATMVDSDGKEVRLQDLIAKGATVVVFYRGGWCPYCNTHLQAWEKKSAEVKSLGATLIAISPEKPEAASETGAKEKLSFMVVSDTKQEAMKGFRLMFTMPESTQKKYKGFGVDLSTRNASKTWDLPHPGTFVIDKTGKIRYAAADANFAKRPDPELAMKVLREVTAAK